jgi:hypothetical protein
VLQALFLKLVHSGSHKPLPHNYIDVFVSSCLQFSQSFTY